MVQNKTTVRRCSFDLLLVPSVFVALETTLLPPSAPIYYAKDFSLSPTLSHNVNEIEVIYVTIPTDNSFEFEIN